MTTAIITFFAIVVAIVLVHEFGHFIFARLKGIKVEEFGFGFPPRIFGWQGKKTLYSFNFIPFGGFVKIKGEDEESQEPDSFSSKPILTKALILAAGGIFNIILGFILLSFLAGIGLPNLSLEVAENQKVVVMNVLEGSPAEQLGIKRGDILLSGKTQGLEMKFQTYVQARSFIQATKGKTIELEYLRGKERIKSTVILNPEENERLGISMANLSVVKDPWYKSPITGAKMTLETIKLTAVGIYTIVKNLIIREPVGELVAGPVGIVSIVNYSLNFGTTFIIHLTALISISIAVINLLPVPALDGGRLAFLFLEAILRRPINKRVAGFVHAAGFSILIILLLIITYFDIKRFF